MEIVIKCNNCNSFLDANLSSNEIYVDVCDKCLDNASDKGYEDGYEDGYNEGQKDAEGK